MQSILAIDIGGTKISASLVLPNNQLTRRFKITTPASPAPDDLKKALKSVFHHFKDQSFVAVAVASTGIILNGHLTALNPDNLGGLKNFPLEPFLTEIAKVPCISLNDAQAAAWAEFDHLNNEVNDLTFLTVSTGVGGGIIQNRNLLVGTRHLAGHLGHTLADPNGPLCGCGRVGCVEAIASGRGIAAQAKDELLGFDTKAIFEQFYDGNVQAKLLITRSAKCLAELATNVKAILDSDCIVLGGSIGLAPHYLNLVQDFIAQKPKNLQIKILSAHHQHDVGLLGAALWARKSL